MIEMIANPDNPLAEIPGIIDNLLIFTLWFEGNTEEYKEVVHLIEEIGGEKARNALAEFRKPSGNDTFYRKFVVKQRE